MSFEVLKYFSSGKISFFWCAVSKILIRAIVDLIGKGLLFPQECFFFCKLMEYTNDHRFSAPIIRTF